MRATLPLAFVAMLAGCGSDITPEEQARRDARDIAMVENAQKQHAPPQPIVLEAIPRAEQALMPAEGKGCVMALKEDPNGDPVGLFGSVTGHIRVDGRAFLLAPDTGSAKVPGGAWSKYVGKTHVVKLEASEAGGAWIAVFDPYDRRVYLAPGELRCGAPASPVSPPAGG